MASNPRRRARVARAGDLIEARLRRAPVDWERVVGRGLAAESAPAGVDAAGALRVHVRNEAAGRELIARAVHVLATWNMEAKAKATGGARARRLAVTLDPALTPRPVSSGAALRPRPLPGPSDADREQATRDVATTLSPEALPAIRDALTRMRAGWLARRRRTVGT